MIGSMLMILVPGIVYIFTEGKIDAKAVNQVDLDALLELFEDLCKAIAENHELANNQEIVKTLEAIKATTTGE